MVDNQHNYYKAAPDKGIHNGPVWAYSGSLDSYLRNLRQGTVLRGGYKGDSAIKSTSFSSKSKRQSSDFWLASLGPLGTVSLIRAVQCQSPIIDDLTFCF